MCVCVCVSIHFAAKSKNYFYITQVVLLVGHLHFQRVTHGVVYNIQSNFAAQNPGVGNLLKVELNSQGLATGLSFNGTQLYDQEYICK